MHRMMQSSGTAEGLRTLIDSSLVKSIKLIMEHKVLFGPPIYSIGAWKCGDVCVSLTDVLR